MENFSLSSALSEFKQNQFPHPEKKANLSQLKEKQIQQKYYLDHLVSTIIDLFDQETTPNAQTFINLIDQVSGDAFIAGVGFDRKQKEKINHALQNYLTYQRRIAQLLNSQPTSGEIIFQLIGHRFPPDLHQQLKQLPLLAYQKHGLLHLEATNNDDFYFIINQLHPQEKATHQKTSGLFIKAASQLSTLDFALYKNTNLFKTNPYTRHESQHFFQHLLDHPPTPPTTHDELKHYLAAGYQGVKDEILAYAKQGDIDFSRQFIQSPTQDYDYLKNYSRSHSQLTPKETILIKQYYHQLTRSQLAFQAFAHQDSLSLNQIIAFFSTLPLPQWVKATKNYAQAKNHHLFYNFAQEIKQNNLNLSTKSSYFQLLQWCDYGNQTNFHHYLQFAQEASQFSDEDSFLLTHKFLSRYQILAHRFQPNLLSQPITQAQITQLQQHLNQNNYPSLQLLSHLVNSNLP